MAAGFAALVAKYGYAATFLGTMFEGESALLLAGIAADRGLLSLPLIVVAGAAGAIVADNAFFALGRRYGTALVARYPRFQHPAARVQGIIARFPNTAVIGVRFLYGMRTVGPVVIGAARMSAPRFLALDVLAALLWSACWSIAGYVAGAAISRFLADVTVAERWQLAGIVAAIAGGVFIIRRRLSSN
jgi:membrane protein DedA with SNARE-associated domain